MDNKLAGAVLALKLKDVDFLRFYCTVNASLVFPCYHEFKLIFLENHTEF